MCGSRKYPYQLQGGSNVGNSRGGGCVSEARFSKEFIKLFQRVRGFKLEKPSVGDTDIGSVHVWMPLLEQQNLMGKTN